MQHFWVYFKIMAVSPTCLPSVFLFLLSFFLHTRFGGRVTILEKEQFVGFEMVCFFCCFSLETKRVLGDLYKRPEPSNFPFCFIF